MPQPSLQQMVRESAARLGFHLGGIAPISLTPDSARSANEDPPTLPELGSFPQWIAEGRAGEMQYLKRQDANGRFLRSSAQVPFPWARSVIVCAVTYNSDQPYSIHVNDEVTAQNAVWIARYAWSGQMPQARSDRNSISSDDVDAVTPRLEPSDYHTVIRSRLEQLKSDLQAQVGEFQARCFVDTGPLVERIYAKYAGLGWQGKNTCLIHESLGSWLFLGVIVTSLELPSQDWAQPMPDRCGNCTRCIDACPTDALEPYRMDASRCIAYLTIEKRGAIPDELRDKIGRNVFGCDICQEVCPWNNRGNTQGSNRTQRCTPVTDWPELQPRPELVNPALDWLAGLNEEEYRREFRGSPVERAKFADFRRNVAIAQKYYENWG
ncbi:MAG: tRNA epoxyqueuosine(34) reductase QueG [Acidobacteriaceae bacterium]